MKAITPFRKARKIIVDWNEKFRVFDTDNSDHQKLIDELASDVAKEITTLELQIEAMLRFK